MGLPKGRESHGNGVTIVIVGVMSYQGERNSSTNNDPNIESQVIYDTENDHYLLVDIGWQGNERIYASYVHIDIKQDLRSWHIFIQTVTQKEFGYNVSKSRITSIYLNLISMCQLTLYCDACVSPIKDGKIWIQQNMTEIDLGQELVAKGVPPSDIILGLHPPYKRPYTNYGVA